MAQCDILGPYSSDTRARERFREWSRWQGKVRCNRYKPSQDYVSLKVQQNILDYVSKYLRKRYDRNLC